MGIDLHLSTCVDTQSPKYLEMAQGHISLSVTEFQAIRGGFLELMSFPLHRQCFLNMSICLMMVLGILSVHIKNVGKAEKTEFTNSNVEPCSSPSLLEQCFPTQRRAPHVLLLLCPIHDVSKGRRRRRTNRPQLSHAHEASQRVHISRRRVALQAHVSEEKARQTRSHLTK
jgi:hypothetical protein